MTSTLNGSPNCRRLLGVLLLSGFLFPVGGALAVEPMGPFAGPANAANNDPMIDEINGVEDIIKMDRLGPKPKYQLTPKTPKGVPANTALVPAASKDSLSPRDAQNLNALWQAVISKNPVIQFGLKQLATPPELRNTHATMMSRTVGGLLTGVGMLPYLMGAGPYAAGTAGIGANIADRAINNTQKIDPEKLPSDIELVELSGMVQTLQKAVVSQYFEYKNSLTTSYELDMLASTLEKTDLEHGVAPDGTRALWQLQACLDLRHRARLAHQNAQRSFLGLERLVGLDGMRSLRFDGDVATHHAKRVDTVTMGPTRPAIR